MLSSLALVSRLRPWRVAAVLLAAAALLLTPAGRAEAAIGLTFTLNDTTASANTDATGTINLEADLNPGDTIFLTFPAGWNVSDGALTGFATGVGSGFVLAPTVTGTNATRRVTFTLNAPQPMLAPINLTLTPSAEIINAPNGTNVTVLVDTSTGQAQGASAPFTITPPATPVTGVTISASPLTENTATTVTVAFTPSATGALAATNTITVMMTGYTLTNGAIAITPTGGFGGAGALTGNVTSGDTVTVTLGGTRSLAALTPATFTFAATNPAAGTVAAAGLTVATSQDVTAVQSSAPIVVAATAVTGVTISAAPLTAAVASTVTVAFTPTATGALAATNTITVTMTGYALTNGAIAITPTVGFVGGMTGNVTGGNTVTVTLSGGASLAASTPGAFTFPATNPAAGTVAAAGLTVRTSKNTTNVASSADIVIVAAALPTAGNSTVTASLPSVPADNATTSTITVTLRTAGNVAVAGKTVTLAQGGGGSSISAASGVSSGAGVVTFTVTNATAQAVTYTATDTTDGVTVTQTATVTFTAVDTPATGDQGIYCDEGFVFSIAASKCVLDMTPKPVIPIPPILTLSALGISTGTLVPAFRSDILSYTVELPRSVESLTVSAVATSSTSPVLIGTRAGVGSLTFAHELIQTTMDIPVVVTSPDNLQRTEYRITITRPAAPAPKITALGLVPLNAAGTLDLNVPPSDWPRADLTGGQTRFTLTVASGRTYGIAAEADSGTITYRRGGTTFDPAATRLTAGDVVTVVATSGSLTSPEYTVRLTAAAAAGCADGFYDDGTGACQACPAGMMTCLTCPSSTASSAACATSCPEGRFLVDTQCQIAPPTLTDVSITLSPTTAGATGAGVTVALTPPVLISAGAKITVPLVGFTFATTTTTCTVSSTAFTGAVSATSAFASNTLTITLGSAVAANARLTCTLAGATLPAAQAAQTTIRLEVADVAGTVLARTTSATMPPIVVSTPELTNAAVMLSSTAASATGVVVTVSFNTPAPISTGGRITVRLIGFTFINTITSCTASSGAPPQAAAAFAANTLAITLTSSAAAGTIRCTVSGGTNPAAQAAQTNVAMSVTDSAGTVLASTSAGTMPAIVGGAPQLTALVLVPTQAGAARITVPVVAGQTAYDVEVEAYRAADRGPRYNLSATMSDPAAVVRVSAFGNQFDPTLIAFQSGESATFSATGSGGTSPTYTIRLRAGASPLTNAAVTLSSSAPAATGVTATVTFNTPVAIPAGGKIKVTLTGFTWPGTPVGAFVSGQGTATVSGAAFASNTLTITTATSAIAAGTVTLTVGGATLPAAQAARTDVRFEVTSSDAAGTVLASTSTGTLVAITGGTAVRGVTISASPLVGGASTTITTVFTPTTALVAADSVTVKMTGYTFTAGAVTVTAGTGISGTLTGRVEAGATDTLVLTGAVATAGTSATFTFPATHPQQAATIAAAGLTLKTSKDTTAVASSNGITITAPTLTVCTSDQFEVTAPTATTDRVCGALTVCGEGFAQDAAPTPTSDRTCKAAGVAHLEFVTQPQDSTTGSADINLSVRAVKADNTVDTDFNNQVQLTIQGGGSSFGLGSMTAVGGVATFTRTYNPSRADATWTLRATQISGRAAGVYAPATSNSFRVTKPPTLAFTTQPVDGTVGTALTTQPAVTAYRADGSVDTAFTGTVTLTLKADTANGAVLTSAATAAVAGKATFTGTSINSAGTGYALVASATGYADVASEPFNVTGAATKIVITQYPAAFVTGRDNSIEVRAEARDADDRVVAGAASELGLLLNGNNTTQRMVTTPTAVEEGVAIFRVSHRFTSAGQYRWGVDHVGGSRSLPQADTEAFTVAKPAAKLAFVQQPGGFGSVLGTQPIVEIQDEDGNRIPGATNEVTLTFLATNDTDPIMTGGAARAATAGRVTYTGVGFTGGTARPGATFTISAASTGLTAATAASFGPAGPTTKLAFTSDLPCGLVARPGCSPAAREGQAFTITVAAQDASGQVNANEDGLATLAGDGNTGMTALRAAFVAGVATFTGVKFTSPSTTGYTLTASLGALTVASGRIVVTQDNTPASLRFTAVPTHEVSGVNFTTQPEIRVYNAAGREVTPGSGSVVLSLHKQDGTTTSTLSGTASASPVSSVVRFNDLRVTGADTGLYLKATLGTLEANQTGTFRVYATATEATTARSSEQSQSVTSSLTTNLDKTSAGSTAASALKNDICRDLLLLGLKSSIDCARVSVTLAKSIMVVDEHGRVLAVANVEAIDTSEIVTIGGLNLRTFEAETSATAPAGTSALYGVARIARDAYGNRLETLSAPRSFSLPVPESALLLGTLPGDLKVAWWDGERWAKVPTRAVVNPDGSFTVTATTDALGAFAVLYAPGASRIDGPGVFSADGAGFGVFAGGSTGALAHAAGLNDATGVWVQDAAGAYRLLVVGGPAFLGAEFASRFPDGIAPNTAVTLVRPTAASGETVTATSTVTASMGSAVAAPVAASTVTGTSAGGTYTVTAADTLSGISARFGVDRERLAAANGIVGPAYVVRTGQALTIPAPGGASTYTVTGTDTLSGIGVRFGVDWMRIAEANGIGGPGYLVRAGQVLTIPR